MSVSLYELSVGSYLQLVQATSNVMAKGVEHCEAQGIPLENVVAASLYQDMAPFHFQAICVAHHSMGTVNALQSGEFGPPNGYGEMDYAGLQGLIDKTLADLKAVDAEEINALAGGRVTFKMGGNELPFSSENFVLSFSLPNFYFHATTLYDILRQQGVPLGKIDFLGPLKMG